MAQSAWLFWWKINAISHQRRLTTTSGMAANFTSANVVWLNKSLFTERKYQWILRLRLAAGCKNRVMENASRRMIYALTLIFDGAINALGSMCCFLASPNPRACIKFAIVKHFWRLHPARAPPNWIASRELTSRRGDFVIDSRIVSQHITHHQVSFNRRQEKLFAFVDVLFPV